ncbi:MAG: hypothetical protein ACJ8R9_10955 [Steroidobacteraceae bacterium]
MLDLNYGNLTFTQGTVTSVALSDGSSTPIYTVSGSPVTGSGTLSLTLSTQTANTVLAGPTSGSAAQPTFRAMVQADLPGSIAKILSVQTPAADTISAPNNTTTNFATSYTFATNTITATSVHRVTMLFKSIASGGALTTAFKSTLGGVDACSFASANQSVAGTYLFTLQVFICGSAAPSAASSVTIAPAGSCMAQLASFTPFSKMTSTVPTNFATNGTLVFQPQFQASVNTAGNSLQLLSMIVEQLNA